MKKHFFFVILGLALSMGSLFAQTSVFKVQGHPHPGAPTGHNWRSASADQRSSKDYNPYDYSRFTFDSIQFWVGQGENRAALVIDWYDNKGPSRVWGFRWPKDSSATGEDMLRAVASADPRFAVLIMGGTQFGSAIGGLGYLETKKGSRCVNYDNDPTDLRCPDADGALYTDSYDFDKYNFPQDTNFRWFSAWTTYGYWSYQLKAAGDDAFSYASTGATQRELKNGDWDGWGAQVGWESMDGVPPRMPFAAAPTPALTHVDLLKSRDTFYRGSSETMSVDFLPLLSGKDKLCWKSTKPEVASVDTKGKVKGLSLGTSLIIVSNDDLSISDTCVIEVLSTDYSAGTLFLNEDWFGHSNGSLNFLAKNGKFVYRAYQLENPGESLGTTSQFGTIYGDLLYMISKQKGADVDGLKGGGRLIVADAKTLQKKASFDTIGKGDGRAFVGIDTHKAYIGTNEGIYLFNIDSLRIEKRLTIGDGSGGLYNAQIGTMLCIGDYVFACRQNTGIWVIDTKKDSLVHTIACPKIGSIVQSLDGSLWATAYSDGLWKINPLTFAVDDTVKIPAHAQIPSSWGAWSSSLICASHHSNSLYWAKMGGTTMTFFGTKVFRYDIDNPNLDSAFYELTREKEAFYGSAIGIDPISNELLLTTTQTGYGAGYENNWVHRVDATTGKVVAIHELEKYYWFPAASVFPDNYAPEIAADIDSSYTFDKSQAFSLDLRNKISDLDHLDVAIHKSILVVEGDSIVNATLRNDSLHIQALKSGKASLLLVVLSNGKVATKTLEITISDATANVVVKEAPLLVTLYPNPSKDGRVSLRFDNEQERTIRVYSLAGVEVLRKNTSDSQVEISLGKKAGMYFVCIGKPNGSIEKTMKVLVQ